ncbi:MAG: chemotaxis protein CheA, partial [Betaproteobacteria bacterium]|nr:chemotaxis protein CheA [Betaproteobacteria bacterium]
MIGELVIAGASSTLIANSLRSQEMMEATSNVSTLVEAIRDTALNLRMVQIGATFSRFQRVVRDLSQELGKEIDLQISGADTELDKSVVEKIADPLTHLVRNSLDHGIESRERRIEAGKSVVGILQLHAYHESGSIVIEVADDGGGLNLDKIKAKAIERGLITPNASLTPREIQNLIFEPGFSTADAVTNLSGRGVGMDVVRQNIQSLRGTIELDSEMGVGTITRIRLPLTLAII